MANDPIAVVDRGVPVSALLFDNSTPAEALRHVLVRGTLLASTATIAELRGVLHRRKFDVYLPLIDRVEFVERIAKAARIVTPREPIRVCRDPKDDCMLEAAVAGSATCIITGDADLLALHPFRGIPILTPKQFLDQVSGEK